MVTGFGFANALRSADEFRFIAELPAHLGYDLVQVGFKVEALDVPTSRLLGARRLDAERLAQQGLPARELEARIEAAVAEPAPLHLHTRLALAAAFEHLTAALSGIRRFPPDLMLIDLSLPDMRGNELLHMIRADAALQAIPAVAITALDPPEGRTFEAAGFDLHIRKPIVDTDELVRSLTLLLKEKQSWR